MMMRTGSVFAGLLMVSTMVSHAAIAQTTMTPVRSITVNGMAKRDVVPDEAHLSVNLNSMEPKLADAKAAHDQKLKKLMSIVKDAGIDDKKVRAQSSNTQPVYEYRDVAAENVKDTCVSTADGHPCPPVAPGNHTKNIRVLMGYRAQTNIDITVSDTAKLGGLMDAVNNAGFEKGGNQEWGDLTSVYYTLSNPDKVRDDMLAEAIQNAHDKAVKMAAAANATIAHVYQIQESGVPTFDFPRPMVMKAMASFGNGAPAPKMAPPAGEQQVNANVTVMYELKD